MKNENLDMIRLEERFPQHRFEEGSTIDKHSKGVRFARAAHVTLECIAEHILNPLGPAIRVREPKRFFGLIPGRIITTAYRTDERFMQDEGPTNGGTGCYNMVCSEITFKPESGFDDELSEQVIMALTPSIPEKFRTPQRYFAIDELGVQERGMRSYIFYEPRGTETLPSNTPSPMVLDY